MKLLYSKASYLGVSSYFLFFLMIPHEIYIDFSFSYKYINVIILLFFTYYENIYAIKLHEWCIL